MRKLAVCIVLLAACGAAPQPPEPTVVPAKPGIETPATIEPTRANTPTPRLTDVPPTSTPRPTPTDQPTSTSTPASAPTGTREPVRLLAATTVPEPTSTKAAAPTAVPVATKAPATAAPQPTAIPPTAVPLAAWLPPISAFDCPATHPLKGNKSSMIYHAPGQSAYKTTKPEQCFATDAAAVAAGYRKASR